MHICYPFHPSLRTASELAQRLSDGVGRCDVRREGSSCAAKRAVLASGEQLAKADRRQQEILHSMNVDAAAAVEHEVAGGGDGLWMPRFVNCNEESR